MVVHHELCSHADLTPRGSTELLRIVAACVNESDDPILATRLSGLVHVILDLADVDLVVALREFGPCIQQWCPILLENMLLGCEDDLSQQMTDGISSKNPLLWLCIWLVTSRACRNLDHTTGSELYRTTKQIISALQSCRNLELEVLQLAMLVTVYEVGHGLHTQAFQTLASAAALLRMLELGARGKSTQFLETLQWLKASILMLDRCVDLKHLIRSL